MFGISPLGWVHTLGSLPAIPMAAYMLARHGRIVPRSGPGKVYFVAMVIGAASLFLFAHASVSRGIAIATLLLLFVGYNAWRFRRLGRALAYVETICLSLTAFLLMLPAVSETLRRVPESHPIAPSLNSPVLLGAQALLLVLLIVGLTAQVVFLRRQGRALKSPDRIRSGGRRGWFHFQPDQTRHRSSMSLFTSLITPLRVEMKMTNTTPDPVAGTWVTADGYIRQELLSNGRYDEARGGEKSAYQGRYEVHGSRIQYRDDTGFEADGEFVDGVLHHIGMQFHRETPGG